ELLDPPDANPAIERRGHDVADLQCMSGLSDAIAIDAHPAPGHEARRGGPRLHDPRVPQPFVDTLSIHAKTSASLWRCSQAAPSVRQVLRMVNSDRSVARAAVVA